jgi:2-(1,2-epoxy-1,2-dihydrophenyl)acetyl-CoA isomerase
MPAEITTEKRGPALIINLSFPERGNALSYDMALQLANILKPLTTDRGTRAILLRGKGGNFINGIDMNLYAGDVEKGIVKANEMLQSYHASIRELQTMDKPVLAAVNGRVAGPGMSFMLAADMVLAARSTQFNCDFTSHALSPDGAASFFLTRKVGAAKATELLMLSETFTAEDAEKWGLLNAIVDDDKLQDVSLQWLDRLAEGPTRAFSAVKALVGKAYEQNLTTHLAQEHTHWGASTRTFDFKEAVRAYFAKRPAKYTGA